MKLGKFLESLNNPGVPVPTVRDPKTGKGSITCTMVVVSFGVCILGVIGKYSKMLGEIDLTAAHSLLVISLSAYLGRKMQKDDKTPES
jgi:hypothetical protein